MLDHITLELGEPVHAFGRSVLQPSTHCREQPANAVDVNPFPATGRHHDRLADRDRSSTARACAPVPRLDRPWATTPCDGRAPRSSSGLPRARSFLRRLRQRRFLRALGRRPGKQACLEQELARPISVLEHEGVPGPSERNAGKATLVFDDRLASRLVLGRLSDSPPGLLE